ncbi:hypothetical protein ILUMI_10835 [Ignelater luminosus]|uniref:Chitin-binding type-2 domain-containing protein n=1 Tax=Ignelater luminosus TaxID=2038154 RepID=A0A8K0D2J1_IGNLU|nr:hypothetical protein ILUMI_10835 [Ignelater luminosus]
MIGVSVFIFIGIFAEWSSAQFLNNRPYPTYSLEQMPDTDFSCRDKILGGYYADPETQCQMFHVCVKVAGVGVQDFRFLCPNGTAFDQDHQICADWEDVDCDATTLYYSSDNFDLYRIGSETDDDEYDSGNVNANQNEDRFQRRKVIRKQPTRRPDYNEDQTQRPGRPTGFVNNFAGSSYIPSTSRPSTTTTNYNDQYSSNNQRGRQRNRVNPQYNNADNFRNNGRNNYEDDGQYREPNTRRSNRFDETQYDDGSYNSKYEFDENAKSTKDDEFLKTAHSTNIASSRNEYLQTTKNNPPVSTTQKPRPFSVTPNSPKATDYTKSTSNASPSTQNSPRPTTNVSKPPPPPPPPQKPVQNNSGKAPEGGKKTKDASYDYAYYDSNVGGDHEYDIGVDIEKADKSKNKKQ